MFHISLGWKATIRLGWGGCNACTVQRSAAAATFARLALFVIVGGSAGFKVQPAFGIVCLCVHVFFFHVTGSSHSLSMRMWRVWFCDWEHQPFFKKCGSGTHIHSTTKVLCGVYLPPLGHRQHPSSFCLRSAAKKPHWGRGRFTALLPVEPSTVKDTLQQLATVSPVPS